MRTVSGPRAELFAESGDPTTAAAGPFFTVVLQKRAISDSSFLNRKITEISSRENCAVRVVKKIKVAVPSPWKGKTGGGETDASLHLVTASFGGERGKTGPAVES